ncbi:RNA-binding protein [Ramlibacter humi]|uniref:RNA-binding protein n=1 Tax=Ramlibacter humi TaxID=2530451 RepID=A0A4Z0CEM2_9BURK|nr:RNA-binding protein [Ramlibacter humi]TFZ08905.1 RNA-binding protein [Ramlibacter humi]
MLPSLEHANRAAALLAQAGIDADVRLLTPGDVNDLAHLFDGHDVMLPSVGTEEYTARHFAELARQGHHALLVPAKGPQACQRVMDALKDAELSCAVHYRHFVIEDLAV